MRKVKKLISLLVASAFAFAMTGCGGSQSAKGEKTTVIRVAFNQSETHPEYKAIAEFGEKFEEATNGAYEMQIYPNALLGDQGSVTELVRTGAIQMAIVPSSIVEGYDKDFALIGAPYIYEDLDHLKNVLLTGVYDDLFKSTERFNFEVVAGYTCGVRNVYSDKPINTPEDLKGYKIRIMESDTYTEMMKLMGGVGTPMAQGEVYTAIQQKVIEGGENNELVFSDFKHYEVSPYYSYTKHLIMPDVVIANERFLEEMSEEHKVIFEKLLDESIEKEFELWDESVEVSIKNATENGATFVYPDSELFRASCEPLLEKVINQSEQTKKLYEGIEALRK